MAGLVSEIEFLNQRESKGERHSHKDDDRRVWEDDVRDLAPPS
jgi:hypothetical protein